jgi:hypothetical protein
MLLAMILGCEFFAGAIFHQIDGLNISNVSKELKNLINPENLNPQQQSHQENLQKCIFRIQFSNQNFDKLFFYH